MYPTYDSLHVAGCAQVHVSSILSMYMSVGKAITPFTYNIPGCDLFVYTRLMVTLHGKVFL